MKNKQKTIFCDIDGTILKHTGNLKSIYENTPIILEGVEEKLIEWDRKGYNIILVTGRRESMRNKTKIQLESMGIFYDKLIMGIGGGQRILINDLKPSNDQVTAIAINVNRNEGLKNVKI